MNWNGMELKGFNGPFEYIACQGPLPSTLADFWQMIWEQRVVIVVMVTSLEERGKVGCHVPHCMQSMDSFKQFLLLKKLFIDS